LLLFLQRNGKLETKKFKIIGILGGMGPEATVWNIVYNLFRAVFLIEARGMSIKL
jgi:hypothetical protein